MKIISKFKQLKREIKLVIITALLASCVGVYATGECIISATADDVSYKNTTVQAAIDELFAMSEDYCPPGYECIKPAIIKETTYYDETAFKSSTYKHKIKTITLDDQINLPSNVIESWDIGEHQNGDVMAYVTQNIDDNTMYDLYIQGDGNLYANPDSSYLFYDLRAVDKINGINKLNISKVSNMIGMFGRIGYNSSVFTLDLGNNFDTSNVKNMRNMFNETGYNSPIFTLDLGDKFDTSNVLDMERMFSGTGYNSTVFTLDLGDKFNTSNVTDMTHMFSYVGHNNPVFTLDLGNNFDTSNVKKNVLYVL